jgi:phosphoadenosine phosphosulfate reductase
MLIPSHRHSAEDLEIWEVEEQTDAIHAQRVNLEKKARDSMDVIDRFSAESTGYLGVSWGKDSVVVAHLAWRLQLSGARPWPMVWVRIEGADNPECPNVRDRFLELCKGVDYEEVLVTKDEMASRTGRLAAMDVVQAGHRIGFARAAELYGDRYVSGVRSAESTARKLRTLRFGTSTDRTCAPIAWWSDRDVFAYLFANGLPVHPAYACTMGGILDRSRVRVAGIGGKRGSGVGRGEWERRYYPEVGS